MNYYRKFYNRNKIREATPYIILIGVSFVIFLIGFVVGRFNAEGATVDTYKLEQSVPIVESQPIVEEPTPEYEWLEFVATAYCPCEICCGEWANKRPLDENGEQIVYGATGIVLQKGVSVAADTTIYPIGTELGIEGMGTYIVHDKGGLIKDNRLDIYFDNHREAVEFGKQTLRVRVIK